jgi:TetR/AcrR family transcriptional regulator, ethionamide resistance regulator
MPSSLSAPASPRRPRHDPKETEREILLAAEQLLRERPLREITVEQIMLRTGLKRPAFYAHFRDRYALMLRIVQDIGEQLFEMVDRWLGAGADSEHGLRAALEGVATVYLAQGPVLRALADAAPSDPRVETAYRALVDSFIDATSGHISAEQMARRMAPDLDARETARALVWLTERYLSEAFGRSRHDDPERIVATLHHIFHATLYGQTRGGDTDADAPHP